MERRITKNEAKDLFLTQQNQQESGTEGVIFSYNRHKNTATVGVAAKDTGELREILNNVLCPTFLGVQMVSPQPGQMCWVTFKNGKLNQPIITHFYNHRYEENDFGKQSRTPFSIPNYLMR